MIWPIKNNAKSSYRNKVFFTLSDQAPWEIVSEDSP